MARLLSQTLIRHSHSPSPFFVLIRHHSDQPKTGHLLEIDLSQTETSTVDSEITTTRRLEEAIEVFFVHKSAPGWLPFAPGSSYWIPPRSRSQGFGLGIILGSEESLTKEEVLSHNSRRGWPSSSYFVDGVMPDHDSTKILTETAIGAEALSDEE